MKSADETDGDDELAIRLKAAKEGPERNEILGQIAVKHGPRLLGLLIVVYRGQLSFEDVEDLIQEAIVAAGKSINQFDPKRGRFKAWLNKIANNKALMEIRKRRAQKRGGGARHVSLSESDSGVAPPEPSIVDDPAANLEAEEDLLKAVEKLPRLQKAIVRALMHSETPDWTGHDDVDKELARRLGTTVGAIRTERSNALSTLRDLLINAGWKWR